MIEPDAAPTLAEIGELADAAGLGRVHILAWRDAAHPEAGGSEVHASHVARLWAAAGLKVMMRTSSVPGRAATTRRDGYTVIRRGGRHTVFARAAVAELAGRHGCRDALVEIWNGVPFLSPIWARGLRAVWLHYPHTELWRHKVHRLAARLGRTAERDLAPRLYRRTPVVTLAASTKRRLVNDFGLSDEFVYVVPPGIDARFCADPSQPRSDTPLLVTVGRLTPYKGHDRVIRAVHRMRRSDRDTPSVSATRLVVIGDGEDRARLQALVNSLDAGDWCRLTGRVDDDSLVAWYRRAWAVVSASESEGWEMTLTEAAACGTPAVASDIDGHRDAVADGSTGHLVSGDDELTAALRLIAGDPGHRDRLGAAALARSVEFRWERTAYDTLAVLAQQRISAHRS